jgi:hypothetical protein
MHLILFLALLSPLTSSNPPVPITPTAITQQDKDKERKYFTYLVNLYQSDCKHRNWKHGYKHPSWCKLVK